MLISVRSLAGGNHRRKYQCLAGQNAKLDLIDTIALCRNKKLFKFEKSVASPEITNTLKEHRRNLSNASTSAKDDLNLTLITAEKKREKVLLCNADPGLIRKIYLPLMGYVREIEDIVKTKG